MRGEYGFVPRISTFYGIVITMYFDDHEPPHFHAVCGEFEARVLIGEPSLLSGSLPPAAFRRVLRWARLHRDALETNWNLARAGHRLGKIEPLP
jgi:hypothetical protein